MTPYNASLHQPTDLIGPIVTQIETHLTTVSQPYLYQPFGWDSAWRTALASAGSSVVPIAGLGDSVLRGHSATAASNNHWWAKAISALQAKYGSAGEGLHGVWDTTDTAYATSNYSPNSAPCWSYSAGWLSSLAAMGVGGQAHGSASGAGNTATGVFTGTGVDVLVARSSGGGPFSVTVDGQPYDKNGVQSGAGGNPTCNNASWQSPFKAVSIRGLTPGSHTIVLTSVSGRIYLHGLVAYNGNNGILPYQMGISGKSAWDILSLTIVDSAKASVELWTPQPKLMLIEHLINDMQEGTSFGRYYDLLRRVCDSAQVAGASILFLVPAVGQATTWTNVGFASRYIDTVYRLAQRYNAAVLNISQAWEAAGTTASFTTGGGNSHPNDAGHADISARLLSLIQ